MFLPTHHAHRLPPLPLSSQTTHLLGTPLASGNAATPCQILSRYREEYEAGGLGTSLVSFLTAMETESDSFDIDEVTLV